MALALLVIGTVCVVGILQKSVMATAYEGVRVGMADISMGDALLWMLCGSPHPDLPTAWIVVLLAVLVGALPTGGSECADEVAMVLGASRRTWWLSSCAECWLRVLGGFALLCVLVGVGTLLLGGQASLAPYVADKLCSNYLGIDGVDASSVVIFLALVTAGLCCLATLQLLVARLVGPVLALIVTATALACSAGAEGMWVPASWLMTSRVAPFGVRADNPLSMGLGLVAFTGATLVFVLVGLVLVREFDPLAHVRGSVRRGGLPRTDRLSLAIRVMTWCLRAGRVVLLATLGIGIVLALVQCALLNATAHVGNMVPNLADYLANLALGSPQPDPNAVGPDKVRVSFAWILLVLLPQVQVIGVAVGARYKANLAVVTHHRISLWAGQCLAVLLGCFALWAAVFGTCALFALVMGAELTGEASDLLLAIGSVSGEALAAPPYEVAPALVGTVAVSCGLVLLQLGIAEAWGHRVGFLVAALALGASVFAMTAALPGNLMMLARSDVFVMTAGVPEGYEAGLGVVSQLCMAGALSCLGVSLGWLVSSKRDYLGVDGK